MNNNLDLDTNFNFRRISLSDKIDTGDLSIFYELGEHVSEWKNLDFDESFLNISGIGFSKLSVDVFDISNGWLRFHNFDSHTLIHTPLVPPFNHSFVVGRNNQSGSFLFEMHLSKLIPEWNSYFSYERNNLKRIEDIAILNFHGDGNPWQGFVGVPDYEWSDFMNRREVDDAQMPGMFRLGYIDSFINNFILQCKDKGLNIDRIVLLVCNPEFTIINNLSIKVNYALGDVGGGKIPKALEWDPSTRINYMIQGHIRIPIEE